MLRILSSSVIYSTRHIFLLEFSFEEKSDDEFEEEDEK
jgi:hypothetical protein